MLIYKLPRDPQSNGTVERMLEAMVAQFNTNDWVGFELTFEKSAYCTFENPVLISDLKKAKNQI
ncbi:hypothetical protein BpHYR1_024771 [Brachionus plicatilis]|uniref:Uncharacterized protein n=1 Tax=Brachionus plicatilis TaxID=10195 RepID=A0A3M7S9U4_BRAPC|nr:hypothetical protein BpHYR1_024771 [Brachionus plicatilis]